MGEVHMHGDAQRDVWRGKASSMLCWAQVIQLDFSSRNTSFKLQHSLPPNVLTRKLKLLQERDACLSHACAVKRQRRGV